MNRNIILVSLAMAGLAWLSACGDTTANTQTAPTEKESNQLLTEAEQIERGKYLVTTMGCNDCHTPKVFGPQGPQMDTTRTLSGHRENVALPPMQEDALKSGWALFYGEGTAMASPAGVAFAANLTPDPTGIGNWTFEQFRIALTRGKFKGLENSRNLLPPMPWENYSQMKEEDLRAMYAYLKSIKPVKNLVPTAILPSARP